MTDRGRKPKGNDFPTWSWIVAALGLVLVVGSSGFLLYQAFAGDTSPPELVIETDAIMPSGRSYLALIRVTNRGGSAAAGLIIEGVLKDGPATVEASAISLDYVPSGSQRRAGLIFSRDPRRFDLQIQAKGYAEP